VKSSSLIGEEREKSSSEMSVLRSIWLLARHSRASGERNGSLIAQKVYATIDEKIDRLGHVKDAS